jgi:hypothetical protein
MSFFEPRVLDSADKYEDALVETLGSSAGMILADCAFASSSRDEKYFLLVLPGDDGPELTGANVAFPYDRAHVRILPITSADLATRKHFSSDRYSFHDHMRHDQAVIEDLGGRAVDPARVWYQGLSTSTAIEDFDVVRVNDRNHEDEARRMVVMHSVTSNPGDERTSEILLDVGLEEFRSWLQDEFQVPLTGGGPRS